MKISYKDFSSEVPPSPGLTSDTETWLVPLLLSSISYEIYDFLPLGTVVQMKKPQGQQFIEQATKKAIVSDPSEVTPVDGTSF